MPGPDITRDGIQIQTYQEIYDELVQGFRDIYGSDIDLDPESPDGQRVGIYASLLYDLQTYIKETARNFDPDFARGTWQESLLKLAGITRRPPLRSQVDVEVTIDRPLTLPEGYTVQDDIGQRWQLQDEVSFASTDTYTVTLFSEQFGEIEAAANTVTEPETIILGVTDVTNPNSATPGRSEETEPETRRRRNRSVQNPAYSTAGSLFARLADIEDVTDIRVLENPSDSVDSRGVPAHGLWCILLGGSVSDITEVIVKNKTGGTALKGSVVGNYEETRTYPDGTDFILLREARFDRPTQTAVEVRLDATRKDSDIPIDEQQIKDNIAAESFRIGENLIVTQLYAAVYKDNGEFYAQNLEVRRKGDSTYISDWLQANADEKFTIDSADVTVNEIIP
jgi:uncharacterized phage protein gp47/JayE